MHLSGPSKRYLPNLVLGLTVSAIMVGAYLAVDLASAGAPKALWSANPVAIQFSGSFGTDSSGSVGDSFKCAPPVAGVTLRTSVSNPTKISLTLSQSSLDCGPSFATITLTAHCTASFCNGFYTGTISIFKDQYTMVQPSLSLNINVT